MESNDIKLIHGDCLEKMNDIADGSVDMVLCDLPYGVLSLSWDKLLPIDKLWDKYNRIVKDNGAIILFGTEPFSSLIRTSNLKSYKYDYVWVKTKAGNFASCRKVPMKYHENIMVFYRSFPTYNLTNLHSVKPIKSGRKNKGANAKQITICDINYMQTESGFNESVLYYSNKSGKGYSYHPTQKPVALLEYLIRTYSNENDLILDNTCGSGSTGVAAVNTNRRFIGIEKDDNYFEIAQKRIGEAIKQKQQTLFNGTD